MTTFTQTKATLDEISERSEQNRKRIQQLTDLAAKSVNDLNAMASDYSAFISQLNTDAAANASDEAWINALAEKNQIVADFQALKTQALALQAAIAAV